MSTPSSFDRCTGYTSANQDCCAPSSLAQHSQQRPTLTEAPSFDQWRARKLFGQDLFCCGFLLLTYVVSLFNTRATLCAVGPPPSPPITSRTIAGTSSYAPADAAATTCSNMPSPSLAWQLMCGGDRISGTNNRYQPLIGINILSNLQAAVNHRCKILANLQAAVDQRCRVDRGSGSAAGVDSSSSSSSSSSVWTAVISSLLAARRSARCWAAQGAWAVVAAVLMLVTYLAQAVIFFFGFGWLTSDPVTIVMPFLRFGFAALLLLPLPLINPAAAMAMLLRKVLGLPESAASSSSSGSGSSSSVIWWYSPEIYWHRPRFRQAVIICQRLILQIAAAAAVGHVNMHFFNQKLGSLKFWPDVGFYIFQCWAASMLMLPRRLQLVVNFIDWLLHYSTATRVLITYPDAAASSSSSSSSSASQIYHIRHFCISLLCIVVVPSLVVWWTEKVHRYRYRQAYPSSSSSSSGCNSSSSSTLSCCSSSSGGSEILLPAPITSCGSSSARALQLQRLSAAVGELLSGEIQEILAAAAAAAAAAPAQVVPDVMSILQYQSVAATLPVSIKVHSAPRTTVPTLGPQLAAALTQHLAAAAAATAGDLRFHSDLRSYDLGDLGIQIQAVVFAGSVQMLACLLGLRQNMPAAAAAAAMDLRSEPSSSSSSSGLGMPGASDLAAAKDLLSRVTEVAGRAGSSSSSSNAPPCRATVVIGQTAVSTETYHDSSGGGGSGATVQLQVLGCQPCCITAAAAANKAQQQQQQITLHLAAVTGSSSISVVSSMQCRLLLFQDGVVLRDADVTLRHHDLSHYSISVPIPPLNIGLVNLALLPSNKPPKQQQQQHEEASSDAAVSAPLLVLPLLVLPAAAAEELEAFWQQQSDLAAAAADGAAALIWQCMHSLMIDIGFLLSAAAAAAAAAVDNPKMADPATPSPAAASAAAAARAVGPAPYPPAVTAALAHVCRSLASYGLSNTLEFLVLHMAAAAAAGRGGARKHGKIDTGGSSSSGDDQGLVDLGSSSSSSKQTAAAAAGDKGVTKSGNTGKTPDYSCGSAKSVTVSDVTNCNNMTTAPLGQLLLGFSSHQMESEYAAVQYMTTARLEQLTLWFNAIMGTACWFAVGPWTAAPTAAAAEGGGGSRSTWSVGHLASYIVVLLCNVTVPVLIVLIRKRFHRQQQQQQQQQISSSSSTVSPQAAAVAAATRAYYTCQYLTVIWMLLISILDLTCALDIILAPPMMIKGWGSPDPIQNISAWLALGIKGWMYQLSFSWFMPLMTLEITTHAFASWVLGLEPRILLPLRYLPALLLAAAMAAVRNIQGRKRILLGRQQASRLGVGG